MRRITRAASAWQGDPGAAGGWDRRRLVPRLRSCALALLAIGGFPASAQTAVAVAVGPGHDRIAVPGRPFGIGFGRDGSSLFVALDDPDGADRGSGRLLIYAVDASGLPQLRRALPLAGGAGGLAVSHDGHLLAVAQRDAGVGFYDIDRLLASEPTDAVIGVVSTGPGNFPSRGSGTLAVGFSNDDALLLATDENQARVSVFETAKLRDPAALASARLGAVPMGIAPVGIAFTVDGRSALVTSEVAPGRILPATCTGPKGGRRPVGLVLRIDLARARAAPQEAVDGASAAGCEAVRVVVAGPLAYVSGRGENSVRVYDPDRFAEGLEQLAAAPEAARVARFAVGEQPVGLGVADRWLLVANSHRWSGGPGDVVVLDRATGRVAATLASADFPREIAVSPDGRRAVVGAFLGRALEWLTLDALPGLAR